MLAGGKRLSPTVADSGDGFPRPPVNLYIIFRHRSIATTTLMYKKKPCLYYNGLGSNTPVGCLKMASFIVYAKIMQVLKQNINSNAEIGKIDAEWTNRAKVVC